MSKVNDGNKSGSTGWWNDGTQFSFPDWVEIAFQGSKIITEVDVYTVQDSYQGPGEPTETMTFSLYGIKDFQVQYWAGSAWVTIPGASITGNNLVWRKFTFPAITTNKIRVLVTDALYYHSRITEVEAWGRDARINVARSPGATVTSSSDHDSGSYPASATVNGDRKGGAQGWWNDGTQNSFPDWLQLDFGGPKTIDEIDVFTVQDNYSDPLEPTPSMTFSMYGNTDFKVQYWDGTGWIDVPGGNLTGNNLVWRKLAFPDITTAKIRVNVTAALNGHSRITELEVYGIAAGVGGGNMPPVAINGGPYYSEAGQPVQTYGGNSYDPDGTVSSYQWNFGDGTTGTGVAPTHVYATEGTYAVSLSVTDNQGATNNSSNTVSVSANPEPVKIAFDNLPINTAVSNQYSQVTFSSEDNYFHPPFTWNACGYCITSSAPNFVTSGVGYGNGNHELILTFKQPVKDLSFYTVGSDNFGVIANIDIWENGSFARTINIYGAGYYYYPIFTDVKPFGSNITKIRIHNIVDPYGLGFDDFTFTPVGKVESVTLEQINSPLDANPNAGGGLGPSENLRIFPDKQSAADTVNRRKVRVRASTSLGANKPVYFKVFDVDDPSTDSPPVDLNSNAGADNKGAMGTLSASSAMTDSNGVATVELTTSTKPGDNFRVAASADQAYLNGLFATGVVLKDASGVTLPTEKAKVSQMLTVWRNLHIEVDSMGQVSQNQIKGKILNDMDCQAAHEQPGYTCEEQEYLLDKADIATEYGGTHNGSNRFVAGRLTSNGVSYEVLGLTCCDSVCPGCPLRTSVVIKTPGGIGPIVGADYTLVDDDDFNSDDGWYYDGDNDENVSRPDTSRLQASDDPNLNVFAPAYVRPKYDVGDNNDLVPFVLNSPSESGAGLISTYDFDAAGTEADVDFWTVYLLGAYQCDAEGDLDPITEQGGSKVAFAVSDDYVGVGSNIFFEMFTEYKNELSPLFNPASTAGHEIGHLFNGRHEDGGLMAPWYASTRSNSFSPITLNTIRSLPHP